MLVHVPFRWLDRGGYATIMDQLGSASQMARLFPQGIKGLVGTASDEIDSNMVEIFLNRHADDMDMMPVHIKIRELMLIRFEILYPNKEAVRKMVALCQCHRLNWAASCFIKTPDGRRIHW